MDIFRRPDGSWGFEEYRREAEDGLGWFVTGHFGERRFADRAAAEAGALSAVPWLGDM